MRAADIAGQLSTVLVTEEQIHEKLGTPPAIDAHSSVFAPNSTAFHTRWTA